MHVGRAGTMAPVSRPRGRLRLWVWGAETWRVPARKMGGLLAAALVGGPSGVRRPEEILCVAASMGAGSVNMEGAMLPGPRGRRIGCWCGEDGRVGGLDRGAGRGGREG